MKRTLLLVLTLALAGVAWGQEPQREVKVTSEGSKVENVNNVIFTVVEEEPEFPGGLEALYQFIAANIKWPCKNCEDCHNNKVYVTFIIEEDGSITNAKVIRDLCPNYGFGDEALRVVKLMPKWKPGRQRGKAVRVQYNLPINFSFK